MHTKMCTHVCATELVSVLCVYKKNYKNYPQQKTFSKVSGFDATVFLPA